MLTHPILTVNASLIVQLSQNKKWVTSDIWCEDCDYKLRPYNSTRFNALTPCLTSHEGSQTPHQVYFCFMSICMLSIGFYTVDQIRVGDAIFYH